MTNGYADDWIQQQKEWKKNMPPQIKEHAGTDFQTFP